jgi:hypothetical protein
MAVLFSDFVNLWKSETDREQPVLLAHRPGTHKAKALAQPQHGFEPLDRASRGVEGLKATDPRHVLFDPEVVALDPLLKISLNLWEPLAEAPARDTLRASPGAYSRKHAEAAP